MVNTLSVAIKLVGLQPLATACGVTYQALRKWEKRGRFPRTEYTDETNYAGLIAGACREKDPHTQITRALLLGLDQAAPHASPLTAPKAQERVA